MFILKKKKKDKLSFSIAFVKNFENLKTIIKSIKKQKIDEVFFIIDRNIEKDHLKTIKKIIKANFKNYSILSKNFQKFSKNVAKVERLNVFELRRLQNKKKILYSQQSILSWKIPQMFPFYTIAFEDNTLYFCASIPLTKDSSGFLLRKKMVSDFIFNITLDLKILDELF